MVLDKQWMTILNRGELTYRKGVDDFLKFAYSIPGVTDRIRCPCNRCRNTEFKIRSEVRFDLLKYGIYQNYITWSLHGEVENNEHDNLDGGAAEMNEDHEDSANLHDMYNMLQDAYGAVGMDVENDSELGGLHVNEEGYTEEPNEEATKFYRLLKDSKEEVYPGCTSFSKLSFIVELLHLKCLNKWSDTSFDSLLQTLKKLLPKDANIPSSYYEGKKYIKDLGLDYVKIDACQNDCVIYWGQYMNAQECPTCHLSRWKIANKSSNIKNIPHKVLRYFPLKSRLQRLYMSSKVASEMRWHKEKRVEDGIMRHPADSHAWKSFDKEYESFSSDPRSVRLGLACDGFQPYGNLSSQHSIWPVVLIPYNLPPWMSMKSPYFMLTLLIPGPKSPGMDIDIYLQPLIEELKELWENGVNTYDAHSKRNFLMRAAILWTINDFPAYADLSGWSTKGFLACPCCHKNTHHVSLKCARKLGYLGHRRWLPTNHKYRKNDASFDGTKEKGHAPTPLSGDDVLKNFNQFVQAPFGKNSKKKYNSSNSLYNWRKKSIFFCLPYWSKLKLRHNLDVMHIEKNVSDNIIGTIMNIKGKTKDTVKGRCDLVRMGIRPALHPIKNGEQVRLPVASYTLSSDEKLAICRMLTNLKSPDGYLSNISRCVNEKERKLSSMKSHDHHIFLQQLLPLAIRGFLPKHVHEPLIELSMFFQDLCSKSLKMEDLDALEKLIPYTLCKLEMIFPPTFFDVMVHLTVYLAAEAKIAGPVQYRWMYPIERYLKTLKSYVRNKSRPEGSIAMGYLADECLTFCSRYLEGIDTRFNRVPRNDDARNIIRSDELAIFSQLGRALGKYETRYLEHIEFEQVHLYVLNNCAEVLPFINQHMEELERRLCRNVAVTHKVEFTKWIQKHVGDLHLRGLIGDGLNNLVLYPFRMVKNYSGYIINGFRFHTYDRQVNRKSQNSGVMVRGDNSSIDKEYYGVLKDIYELQYGGGNRVVVFKCDWWDVVHKSGYKKDQFGYISVNSRRYLATCEPFVLASQAEQVFYIEDPKEADWLMVIKTKPRDLYSMPIHGNDDVVNDEEEYQIDEIDTSVTVQIHLDKNNEANQLSRNDVEDETVDGNNVQEIIDLLQQIESEDEIREEFINEEDEMMDYLTEDDEDDSASDD